MKIGNKVLAGVFVKRLNRFEAIVKVDQNEELVHVPNTGRCRELFIEGAEVLLEQRPGEHRKTKYELIMVYKGNRLISIDSQLPNKLAEEAIRSGVIEHIQGYANLRREAVYGNSRFDLLAESPEGKCYIEVKGVTLERENIAMFPDAPTERGAKHVNELVAALSEGHRAVLIFVIQLKNVDYFTPNAATDPEFNAAIARALAAGVEIYAYDCVVEEDEVRINSRVPVRYINEKLEI